MKPTLLASIRAALKPQKPKRTTTVAKPVAAPAVAAAPVSVNVDKPAAPVVAVKPLVAAAPAVEMTAQEAMAMADANYRALSGGESLAEAFAAGARLAAPKPVTTRAPALAAPAPKAPAALAAPKATSTPAEKATPARAPNPLAPTASWPEKYSTAIADAGWRVNVSNPVAVSLVKGTDTMNVAAIAMGLREFLNGAGYFPSQEKFDSLAASIQLEVLARLPKSASLL